MTDTATLAELLAAISPPLHWEGDELWGENAKWCFNDSEELTNALQTLLAAMPALLSDLDALRGDSEVKHG